MEYYDETDGISFAYEILSSVGFVGAQLMEFYYIGSIPTILVKEVGFGSILV